MSANTLPLPRLEDSPTRLEDSPNCCSSLGDISTRTTAPPSSDVGSNDLVSGTKEPAPSSSASKAERASLCATSEVPESLNKVPDSSSDASWRPLLVLADGEEGRDST